MLERLLGISEEYKNKALNIREIKKIDEDTARQYFQHSRWGGLEQQICPQCGKKHKAYYKKTRQQWVCKYCNHTFSLTSGTLFHATKLSFVDIFYLLNVYINRKTTISVQQLSRDTGISAKSLFLLTKKIQFSFLKEQNDIMLSGEVHIDGKYHAPKKRKSNQQYKNKAINNSESKLKNTDNKTVIINATCKYKDKNNNIVKKTIAFVAKEENKEAISYFIHQIKDGSTIYTDGLSSYNFLASLGFNHQSVNHKYEFCTKDKVNNNLAENFNSLLNYNMNLIKHISKKYLSLITLETAYRANHNKELNSRKLRNLTSLCLNHPPVKEFIGYFQKKATFQQQLIA